MKKNNRRYRGNDPLDARENQRMLRRRANTSRDYATLQRMGVILRVGGVLLALVLLVYGGYVVVNGVLPYMEEKMNSSQVSEEVSSAPESALELPLRFDELGLPIYENEVSLRVINAAFPAEEEDAPELAAFQGALVDERILPALEAMFAAAEKDGVSLRAAEGYVSHGQQSIAFDQRVEKLVGEGMTAVMAANQAEKQVGRPGKCDLQTGLCVRISGDRETFTTTDAYDWLNNHALTYGFVFRYPVGVEEHTGHEEDLLVLRYVGAENARQMRRLNMCLEEYVEYISRQG